MSFEGCFRATCARLVPAVLAVTVWSHAAPAFAETDEQRAGARAAATEAGKAFMGHQWAQAIDLFSRAEALVHSPVHLLYIARSHAALGLLVKAREAYIKVANEDLPANAPGPFKDAKADAQRELSEIEPRIPYVSVVVQGAGPKPVTVMMDGVQVPPVLLGVPRPVDPGEHRFDASAEGMESAQSTVVAKEGKSETVVLTLQASAQHPMFAPTPTPAPQPTAPPPEDKKSGSGLRVGSYVALGVGVVGLGIGTVFALKSSSKRDDANNLCNIRGSNCPLDQQAQVNDLDDQADSAASIATAGFVIGGVGIATGVVLFIVSSGKSKQAALAQPSHTPSIHPWVGLGSAGVSGRF